MKYSFEDWLNDVFVMEKMPGGGPVLNNSWNYQFLADQKLDYPTLDKIQEAQDKAYEAMVLNELEYKKKIFHESASSRPEEVRKIYLKDIEAVFEQQHDIYRAIIIKKKHRGIRWGAAFIPAKMVKEPLKFPSMQGMVCNKSDGEYFDPTLMFEGQINYILIDALVRFRDYLNELLKPTKQDKPNSREYSYYAMALHLKSITISTKGIGVNDGIDYAEKFNLNSGKTLYNKLNDITNDRLANPESFKNRAQEIIKEKNL